ncbi:uncharacterized protein LOC132740110 [Ruditapes philippinarum]|uniref:uncharacterized protein LOC132740110 n=1 Tax=Ruditapes philippinarum TaxID=129788 RepID=UPI00295A94D8|nr:uncharacterized protein LOC132740110 [Ruditapes philippinarum]XP_060583948.1 uncharacterized protein LOC132740110 [Ruditapes philippinarum]
MKYWIILAGCLALIQVTKSAGVCSEDTIKQSWQKCDNTYFVSDVKDMASMKKMCSNVECLVQCKKNAVGDCASQEEFREHLFMFDPEKWKVYYRFTCSNFDDVMQQFNGGCSQNDICSGKNITNFNTSERDLKILCSSLEATRKCVSMSPSPDGKTCTADGARFQEDIRKLGYSISICENTDIKQLYTKYGGPYKCGSSSATAKVKLSFTAFSLAMLTWIKTRF